MMNNTPFYCVLTAALARVTLAASVLWCLAAVFGGQKDFITHEIWLLWIIVLCLLLLNILLLRKDRKLLVVAAVDTAATIALTIVVYSMLSNDGDVIALFMGICAYIGAISQICWHIFGFNERELTNEMQFLTLAAVLQLITAGLLDKKALWAGETLLLVVFVLLCAVISRNAGIRDTKKRQNNGVKNVAISAAVVCFLGGITWVAGIAAGPAAKAVSQLSDIGSAAGNMILTAIGYIYIFLTGLFKSSKLADVEKGGSVSGNANIDFGEPTGNIDFVKVVFSIMLIVFVLVMLIAVLDTLRNILMVKIRRSTQLAAADVKRESFWKRLKTFVMAVVAKIRVKYLFKRYPASVSALLWKLEKKCRRNSDLRKLEGETAREFITRVSELTENEEFSRVLAVFADEVDAAFYGREKNYLKEFSQHKKMLKTLKNSLTTRV